METRLTFWDYVKWISRYGLYPEIYFGGSAQRVCVCLHRRGLKSRLISWKSVQADLAWVGFNRLACLEQGIYPRRNGGCVGYGKPSTFRDCAKWILRYGLYPEIYFGDAVQRVCVCLHRRGLKSRLISWKSAQADLVWVGFNRLACLEQGVYPRRNGGCVGYGKPPTLRYSYIINKKRRV